MPARPVSRARHLLVVLLATVGLVAAGSPALAEPGRAPAEHDTNGHGRTYLALGDSVPFGFRGSQPPEVYADPANFVGYPELVADDLGLRVLNASCPGETTESFIDATAQSNGCQNSLGSDVGHRDFFPLHVDYEGSQLDYAVEVLQQEPRVRVVTLQLGANDGFLCVRTGACSTPEGFRALAARVGQNVDRILATLREEACYSGRLAVVTYYALDYTDPAATQLLNAALAAAAARNGAVVADGFAAFAPRALAAGGSSIAAGLVPPADVHPTEEGQRLLAGAVEQAVGH
ncbi:SGNH/GDSL hydrolase family protein [Geodermatophilus sp. CPCC 205761]|uniref:SGNH/GDSL hydrolase family protein n=1 Tax=Geodermatophilus sp. CPCC 205761 TaxID=2936597 RepID=UPI003EEBE932